MYRFCRRVAHYCTVTFARSPLDGSMPCAALIPMAYSRFPQSRAIYAAARLGLARPGGARYGIIATYCMGPDQMGM